METVHRLRNNPMSHLFQKLKIILVRLTLLTVLTSSSNLRCLKKSQSTKEMFLTRLLKTAYPKLRLYSTKHRCWRTLTKTLITNMPTVHKVLNTQRNMIMVLIGRLEETLVPRSKRKDIWLSICPTSSLRSISEPSRQWVLEVNQFKLKEENLAVNRTKKRLP